MIDEREQFVAFAASTIYAAGRAVLITAMVAVVIGFCVWVLQ